MRSSGIIIIALLIALVTSILPVSAENDTISKSTGQSYFPTDPIGTHTAGEIYFINGTTNNPDCENNISIWVRNWDNPTWDEGWIDDIPLEPSTNNSCRWSANATNIVRGIGYGDYEVHVFYTAHRIRTAYYQGPSFFKLLPRNNSSSSTVFQTTKPGSLLLPAALSGSPLIQPTPLVATGPPTTQSSPSSLALSLLALAGLVTCFSCFRNH